MAAHVLWAKEVSGVAKIRDVRAYAPNVRRFIERTHTRRKVTNILQVYEGASTWRTSLKRRSAPQALSYIANSPTKDARSR